MPGPLLETKFFVPRPRRALVSRARLSQQLKRTCEAKLTLIAAPAGFGKTTLLADWLATIPPDDAIIAWLSLDQSDNDPTAFWTYLVAALHRAVADIGAAELALLQSPQPPPIESVLTAVLNQVAEMHADLLLVLDDYHVLEAHDIQPGMTFLLDHLPPQMHLVIATRADPPLPLARLRARGELVEVRAADLRFTADEATAYLNEAMGLHLSRSDVVAIEDRTEGWITALQLVALSMQGREDVGRFIASFTGADRYILDYLVEEVLRRQPQAVREFLLQTSILDGLSASLCDAVIGEHTGKAMLQTLEARNLFVMPLDDSRHWYRYHHLFADVLRSHLADEQPDLVSELHRRASAWFERNGDASHAVSHALAAEDFPKAADLIELAAPATRRNRQESTLLSWLKALPEDVITRRPVLCNAYAGALLSIGVIDGVDARLDDAQRWLDTRPEEPRSVQVVVVDEAEFRRLPGAVAVHRAGHALLLGNVSDTVEYARRARGLLADDDLLGHASAAALLGLACWRTGDLEEAHRNYTVASANLQAAGHISDVLGCTIALADLRITQGRLHEAMRTYERALQLAAKHGPAVLRGTADMYVGISELHRERNDLQAAQEYLDRSLELGEHEGLPQNPYRWRLTKARIREAQGDLDGALDLLQEAERVYTTDFSPDVRPIGGVRARMLCRNGRVREALEWTQVRGLSASDELSYVHEYEHITLARVLLGHHSVADALGLLQRLLSAADAGARGGSVIEISLLQALAHQAQGDTRNALIGLERALKLAEPEGYARIFLDEGADVVPLLRAATKARLAPDYAHHLLTSLEGPRMTAPPHLQLVEPLSEREVEVLRLLGTELSGPDIARELTVSLSTLRTHTQNIFNKLGVNNRRAAVRRAEQLDLISEPR